MPRPRGSEAAPKGEARRSRCAPACGRTPDSPSNDPPSKRARLKVSSANAASTAIAVGPHRGLADGSVGADDDLGRKLRGQPGRGEGGRQLERRDGQDARRCQAEAGPSLRGGWSGGLAAGRDQRGGAEERGGKSRSHGLGAGITNWKCSGVAGQPELPGARERAVGLESQQPDALLPVGRGHGHDDGNLDLRRVGGHRDRRLEDGEVFAAGGERFDGYGDRSGLDVGRDVQKRNGLKRLVRAAPNRKALGRRRLARRVRRGDRQVAQDRSGRSRRACPPPSGSGRRCWPRSRRACRCASPA